MVKEKGLQGNISVCPRDAQRASSPTSAHAQCQLGPRMRQYWFFLEDLDTPGQHVTASKAGREAVVPLVKTKADSAILLATGEKAKVHQEHNGRLVVSGLPEKPPHPYVNVIKVSFADVPASLNERNKAGWLSGKA